jgi:D-alanyl-lipoteichoic acid acyltransferase DltB (MBOAT superfamily)
MRFNSLDYFLLLLVTLVLFYNLRKNGRLILLIASSIVFYSFWNLPLVSLIIISAVVDYSAGLLIHRSATLRRKRIFLLISLCTNLGLLGYFKYANFFLDNFEFIFGGGVEDYYLNILLPPGISFYTFQTMSYTIDVYRGQITPTRSFLRFFVYVSFFPQLVAGPIERAAHLLTQFDYVGRIRFRWDNFVTGSRMIVWGMFKKVMIADYVGDFVDVVFAQPDAYTGWSNLLVVYGFGIQVYCDFSAYSEIARGSARLFGIDLMQNFDQPWLSTNISEFWRRWHISLSTWIRDYIYIPLGGSQKGRARAMFNLVVTMFLSGLWHGAAWSYVLWGFSQGFMLLAHNIISRQTWFRKLGQRLGVFWVFLSWITTANLIVLSWVFFRGHDMPRILEMYKEIGLLLFNLTAITQAQLLFLVFGFVFMIGSLIKRRFGLFDRIDRNTAASVVFYGSLIVIMLLLGKREGPQFIYFQF